jgi:hypothetical protein
VNYVDLAALFLYFCSAKPEKSENEEPDNAFSRRHNAPDDSPWEWCEDHPAGGDVAPS